MVNSCCALINSFAPFSAASLCAVSNAEIFAIASPITGPNAINILDNVATPNANPAGPVSPCAICLNASFALPASSFKFWNDESKGSILFATPRMPNGAS